MQSPTVPSFPRDSRHVLFSSADSGANGTTIVFFPPHPPARGTQMRSWCLVAIGRDEFYSALGPFRFIYLCENPEIHKIFSLHQKTHHQSILRIHSSYSKATRCRLSEVPSNKLTLKIKKRKKGFGFGRVKIAFATSHERIIKMDNDNNHMQEKVTNTYHLNLLGRVPKYDRALDSVWGWKFKWGSVGARNELGTLSALRFG